MKSVLLTLFSVFVAASVVVIFVVLWTRDSDPAIEIELVVPDPAWDGGFRVRFGITNIGVDYFVELPRSVTAAKNQGWSQAPRANSVFPSLSMYCQETYTVCVLFDDTEYVAGLQIAFPEDEFVGSVYDWEVQGFSKWTPGNDTTYWAIQQYFVNEEYLAISRSRRLLSRDANKTLQAGAVWVTGNGGELVELSGNTDAILANGFTLQACIPFMGVHYYRHMTPELECSAETMFPWFPLTDYNQELIATGLVFYGKFEGKGSEWFETPAKAEIEMIVPRGPQCLYELADGPGVITMHIYYVDAPWTITC